MSGDRQISRQSVVWQLLACVLVVLPHLSWLPAWVPGLLVLTLFARVMIHQGRWSLPSKWLKLVLVASASMGLILSFGRQSGPETMVALLVVAMSLKLLEIYRRRDALVLIYVALFVLGTAFLFTTSAWIAFYALAVLVVVLAALLSIHQRRETPVGKTLRRVCWLLGPAVPLMVLLFLVFPRLDPLWSVTMDEPVATTGLSDSMSPGDVSSLAQSDELAFRATFTGEVPPAERRYWRSLVLDHFDGRQWRQSSERDWLRLEALEEAANQVEYEVVFEPSQRPWLVALDQPVAPPAGLRMRVDRTLLAPRDLTQRYRYSLAAAQTYALQPQLTPAERQHYQQLPQSGGPRARALAQRWFQDAEGSSAGFVQRMMQHYNAGFSYTLSPGRLFGDSIDRFLFDSREGYCEHFASATTFMLRSVGIPARVVTGYQGGEWNPYQGYLQVRQYDAHAWVEAWMDGRGWVRLDPTAAVAPERIRNSAEAFLRERGEALASGRVFRSDWLRSMQQRYDAFNFVWQRWVLNYESQQQDLLGDWLGGLDYWRVALFLMVPGAAVFMLVAWRQLRQRSQQRLSPVNAALARLQQRLGERFTPRQPDQSLAAWLHQLQVAWPEQAQRLERLSRIETRRRYAAESVEATDKVVIALVSDLLRQLPRGRRS